MSKRELGGAVLWVAGMACVGAVASAALTLALAGGVAYASFGAPTAPSDAFLAGLIATLGAVPGAAIGLAVGVEGALRRRERTQPARVPGGPG